QGGFTPFSFEITGHITPGENVLTVYVDATETAAVPPYGNLVDYLTFGGLYRDVSLRIVNACHITSAFARPTNVLTDPGLECDVQLAQWVPGLRIEAGLQDAQGNTVTHHVQAVESEQFTVIFPALPPVVLWTLQNPALYTLILTLSRDGTPIDRETTRIGFRRAEFCDDGRFLLNGEPLKLFGLNRHQTYPYIGAAAPARLQQLDADILKYELGCNLVRTSHYAQSPHFLNRCDEIGLLVFEEIAGWQHIGDEAWQALVLQDLQAMIHRDRNHPSIILWGVRINESPDHPDLYTRTNALAHELDPTRPTGGVRNFIESAFLEDVFTLNDFPEGIQSPRVRPHLITEFGGHMFPTKVWDHEERRVAHALLHARKHNAQMGHPDIAGAIGWCAFDYHTHKEFGSGDRICYHGVMDIFRLPKMAAYFYRSQKSPSDDVVLYAATNWTMGDRSGGGNNPLVVFSNCDEIELWIGEQLQGCFQPDSAQYPHLPHPPFVARWPEPYDPWGREFHDLTVRGFINGQCVAEQKIAADHVPDRLILQTHTAQLQANGADMARITVQIVDRYGNVLPYQLRSIEFSLGGDAKLIGENPFPLLGGQGACYIKSGHTGGTVILTARTVDLPPVSIEVAVEVPIRE
ncbi:MAG: glycoside hydrolase family 2 protein, partial [Anaerolineae bacterium]|nr:glycoside hydrolase family 2 protein [Anaerolineae bacterium]